MKPLIGITSDYQPKEGAKSPSYWLAEEYVLAIASCGGIPLILPPIDDDALQSVLARLDALVISGGDFDLEPELYGEPRHSQLGRLNPRRSKYELDLLRAALAQDLPLLGICGGLQLLNVALGGSLYQHLPDQLESDIEHEQQKEVLAHRVSIEPQSILNSILQTPSIMVNSTHHQAIKQLGEGLKAVAWAPDGVIEAVQALNHRFVLGVQWHPESLITHSVGTHNVVSHNVVSQQPIWKKLFERFMREASQK